MLLACAVAPLLAFNLTPSATLFNQLAALAGWGLVLICIGMEGAPRWRLTPAAVGLALLAMAPWASHLWGGLPASLALANSGMLLAALALLLAGQGLARDQRHQWVEALCWGLLLAGVLSLLVGLVQVFMPGWADGNLIARSGIAGRAVGNMRQPNHLASLLMWACVAAVYLADRGRFKALGGAFVLPLLLFGLVFAVVLSASRTGVIGVLILACWGALDRKLGRASKLALMAAPLLLALSWVLLAVWATLGAHALGAESRLAEGAGSPSRLAIIANAWALLKANPWMGLGWGEFNLAWTMTPFPDRPIAFFDHTHNIVMQLAVELGLPLSLLILGLLTYSLWRAFALSRAANGVGADVGNDVGADVGDAVARRCAFMLVLMIGLHSLLEYPLWYAYFLLPTAFAFGLALGSDKDETASSSAQGWALAGALMLAASAFTAWNYLQVVDIYAPSANAQPLLQRIAKGQASTLFSTQANYAAATSLPPGPAALAAAQSTAHNLIDARLLVAWAKSLQASGDVDKARYVVQRLREFRNPAGDDWLAECEQMPDAGAVKPFQCEPPLRDYSWRELRQ